MCFVPESLPPQTNSTAAVASACPSTPQPHGFMEVMWKANPLQNRNRGDHQWCCFKLVVHMLTLRKKMKKLPPNATGEKKEQDIYIYIYV